MADNPENTPNRAGSLLFVGLFVVFATFLLTQLGTQTKYVPKKDWVTQPGFWPAIGVISMVGFGLLHLATSWRERGGWRASAALNWLRAFEYLAWFMIYVWLVPILGYLAATVMFTVALALRQGYRTLRTIGASALLGFAIVLVFKAGLSVKIPGGAVYEHLPVGLRNFMILNF